MTPDITTISICVALLLLSAVSPFANPFFRKNNERKKDNRERKGDDTGNKQQLPPISIVITAHDNATEIQRNLPSILTQKYDAGIQVIVVAEKGDSETEDILKLLASQDNRLYYTLIPESSRYMSRKKLAMTVGIKAARHEWVMLTEPTCTPVSDQWIAAMAANCRDGIDMVTGYSNFNDNAPLYCRFERLQTECYLLHETDSGMAYRHSGANLLLRKRVFMENEGFRGNLNLVRGEYDFIVNKFATANNTISETSGPAWVREQRLSHKEWKYRHLNYLETRKLLKRSFRHRLTFNTDQALLHIPFIITILAISLSATFGQWLIAGAAIASLAINATLRGIFMRKCTRMFGERIPSVLALPLQLAVGWHHIYYFIQHLMADKLDFTTHKL